MSNEVSYCPVCNARVEPGKPCWLCKSVASGENVFARPLEHAGRAQVAPSTSRQLDSENPFAPPTPIGETPGASLASIVLVVGLMIVLASLTIAAPGLGILLFIAVTPALIRTAIVVGKRKRLENRDVSVSEKSVLFVASFAGVVAAAGAAAVAFGVTCVATCFGVVAVSGAAGGGRAMDSLFVAALVLSCVIGLGMGGYTLYRLWRRKA
jgi:hypothetical protein